MTELLRELTVSGVLTSDWAMTFLAVSRQEFLPDTVWVQMDGRYRPVHRHENPARWRELADSDESIVTQVDNGRPAGPDGVGEVPTSSSSMPRMVALMLKYLDVHGGERVLEIGTGTGWNAALLAERLGAHRITSIEIDHQVAEQARAALDATGFHEIAVITGNGTEGYPPEAPYHRVISTASCHTVPYAWVEQCRPGGRIVTPWGTEFDNWGLLVLTVHANGTATGKVVGGASFMRLRDQRIPHCPVPSEDVVPGATVRKTGLRPTDIVRNGGVLLAMSAHVPNCQARYKAPSEETDGEAALYLTDRHSGSWARLYAHPDEDVHEVTQGGERRLFDDVEAVYTWWERQGSPSADKWRITVDKDGQRIELLR